MNEVVAVFIMHTTRGARGALARETGRRGMACVELALVLPLLLMLVVGIVDLGRYAYAYVTITNAARNGAYYGSNSTAAAADTAGIRAAALSDTASLAAADSVTVTTTTALDSQGYTLLRVTVSYRFRLIAGVSNLIRTVPLSRTVQMRVTGSL